MMFKFNNKKFNLSKINITKFEKIELKKCLIIIILTLGFATFLHYFNIFTFHTEHYWTLLFILSSLEIIYQLNE